MKSFFFGLDRLDIFLELLTFTHRFSMRVDGFINAIDFSLKGRDFVLLSNVVLAQCVDLRVYGFHVIIDFSELQSQNVSLRVEGSTKLHA